VDKEVNLSDNFKDYPEWNSLANLSLVAMIDEEFGVVIDNAKFKEVSTIEELWKLVSEATS
jgi:acyl carrier protein